MLDFGYFELSISIEDNLFEISNLEIIARMLLCVYVFNISKRIFGLTTVFFSSKLSRTMKGFPQVKSFSLVLFLPFAFTSLL